jgi:YidC/Oxa1 family membrane protein insertase
LSPVRVIGLRPGSKKLFKKIEGFVEKRVILFLVFSLFIILVYPFLLRRFSKPPSSLPTTPKLEKKALPPGEPPPALPGQVFEAPEEEKRFTIDTELYRAVFSNKGGGLVSWKLKDYADEPPKKGEAKEKEIDLIPSSKRGFVSPFSILLGDEEDSGFYGVEENNLPFKGGTTRGVLRFVRQDGGKRIAKEYLFEQSTYQIGIRIETTGIETGYTLSLGTNTGIHRWAESFGGLVGPIIRVNGEKTSLNPAKMKPVETRTGRVSWVGQQDKYFLAAILPTEPADKTVEIRRTGDNEFYSGIKISGNEAKKTQSFEAYLGPKEYGRLQSLHRNLEETVDFGWFIFGSWWLVRMIAKPLFYILKFLYSFSHNYGVSIILVTCIVKAAFFPISLRAMRSMSAMQQIQPKLMALKKKYEKDREKLNREMMELYKVHHVNPLGGCLPMLVQLPVFVALFNVLYVSIEMRNAPFVFWIRDLSSFDHFYILPLIYGATTYLLQRMQPPGMDPQQAQMIAIVIPVVTTFLFLNFPSGLVLYWVVNNLLSIGQQHLIGPRPT